MANLESLLEQLHVAADSDTARWLHQRGVALADEETMAQAIHDVYCGIAADHEQPNEKDHQQALAMIGALQKQIEAHPPA